LIHPCSREAIELILGLFAPAGHIGDVVLGYKDIGSYVVSEISRAPRMFINQSITFGFLLSRVERKFFVKLMLVCLI